MAKPDKPQDPQFVEELEDMLDPDAYKALILRLRNRFRDSTTTVGEHTIPVLPSPPQQGSDPPVFDVILHHSQPELTMRLRLQIHNLYVIGYRAENGGQWHEFRNDTVDDKNKETVHLIKTSKFVKEGVNYQTLENVFHTTRANVPLGGLALEEAVRDLLTRDTGPERPRAIVVIAEMIAEATRITHFLDRIADSYGGYTPSTYNTTLQTKWSSYSGMVLKKEIGENVKTELYDPGITIEGLAALLSVLMVRQHNSGGSHSELLRAVDMEIPAGQTWILPKGRALCEIFSVRILNIDDENPGDLYGTIRSTDGIRSTVIYHRERSQSEEVKPHDFARLTGPGHAITAADNFTIEVDLKDRDADLSPDDEIARGRIEWNAYDFTNDYDMVKTRIIDGEYGSVELRYAVMSEAAEARVSVKLLNGDDEDPAHVYGKVIVENTSFGGEIELLSMPHDPSKGYQKVKPGHKITLQRDTVVVGMNSSLKLHLHLWDYDSLSSDDEIAKGSFTFPPDLGRTDVKWFTGQYGEVEVRVEWI